MAQENSGGYDLPIWSAIPSHKFKLNVLKEGKTIETVSISDKAFYKFGRETKNVDFRLMHPSCSRFHCVIQHKNGGECYLFDLNSINKTFLNKKAIRPLEYTKFQVGDFVQFGESSRFYFLDGPKSLMPPENSQPLEYEDTNEINIEAKFFKRKSKSEKLDGNDETKGDFCSWGQTEETKSELSEIVNEENCKTANLKRLYEELKELNEERNKAIKSKVGKKRLEQLDVRIDDLKNDIEDKILNSEAASKKRRKVLHSYIDDNENDDYYDRTIKNTKRSKPKTSKEKRFDRKKAEKERVDLQVEASNLEIKLKRERESETDSKTHSDDKTGKDSLDSFMEDVQEETRKRKIKRLEKAEAEIKKRLLDVEKRLGLNTN